MLTGKVKNFICIHFFIHISASELKNSTSIKAMLALLTAGASAAAAIVYLAHKGNIRANWFAICQQFNSFCERTSGALVGSFVGIVVFVLLILMSAATLSRRPWSSRAAAASLVINYPCIRLMTYLFEIELSV